MQKARKKLAVSKTISFLEPLVQDSKNYENDKCKISEEDTSRLVLQASVMQRDDENLN